MLSPRAGRRPRPGPPGLRHLAVIHALLVGSFITQAFFARLCGGESGGLISAAATEPHTTAAIEIAKPSNAVTENRIIR